MSERNTHIVKVHLHLFLQPPHPPCNHKTHGTRITCRRSKIMSSQSRCAPEDAPGAAAAATERAITPDVTSVSVVARWARDAARASNKASAPDGARRTKNRPRFQTSVIHVLSAFQKNILLFLPSRHSGTEPSAQVQTAACNRTCARFQHPGRRANASSSPRSSWSFSLVRARFCDWHRFTVTAAANLCLKSTRAALNSITTASQMISMEVLSHDQRPVILGLSG